MICECVPQSTCSKVTEYWREIRRPNHPRKKSQDYGSAQARKGRIINVPPLLPWIRLPFLSCFCPSYLPCVCIIGKHCTVLETDICLFAPCQVPPGSLRGPCHPPIPCRQGDIRVFGSTMGGGKKVLFQEKPFLYILFFAGNWRNSLRKDPLQPDHPAVQVPPRTPLLAQWQGSGGPLPQPLLRRG